MNFPIRPEQASSFAVEFDSLFFMITALTVFFTIMVGVMCFYLIIKYKRGHGKPEDRRNPMHHNTTIEVTWSLISLFLGLGIFGWSTKLFMQMREVPDDAMEIFVVGKRWMWHIQHSNGVRENNELHIPVGVPVKLTMISQDVVHSFYIPQFRAQFHVVPGRYTTMWFKATKTGRFNLFCAMHCGTQHSEMGGYVYVLEQAEFARWKQAGGNRFKPVAEMPAARGKDLFEDFACANCHTDADTPRGPSLNGLFGRRREFTDGSSGIADMSYIRQALLSPDAKIVRGFRPLMQPYNFTEEQIFDLIEHIKTLGAPITPVTNSPTTTMTNDQTTVAAGGSR